MELNYQIEQKEKQFTAQEEENKKIIEELNNKMNNGNNKNNTNENQQIKEIQDKLEEQQRLNTDLTEELSKVKKDNELLTKEILNGEKRVKT